MKWRAMMAAVFIALSGTAASGVVFVNEVFINPPGSLDDTREFIEFMGTPGKKLDGYAIGFANGGQTKLYPVGSIPPPPEQEFDEFFSLDGLEIGPNGILVIGVGALIRYPTVLPDSNFAQWSTLWNGNMDTPGKLENDGSNTLFLVRNRPGATEAAPGPDLRWGKDVLVDDELETPYEDPPGSGMFFDRYGNGAIDKGEPNHYSGNTIDLRGFQTPADLSDDLEIVDEFSYEHDQGWEYDIDNRKVDAGVCTGGDSNGALCENDGDCDGGGTCIGGSTLKGLPPRNVHSFDDPQGINPDAFSRVDYRTKGPGWAPAGGGTGVGPGGNNPQDTVTEQWVRGESVIGTGGEGAAPQFFYSNAANINPDAIQPYDTHVPLWLNDASGLDYDFTVPDTYQIMAGRVNPLAVPFIPGDADRDGDADTDDIAKIAAVFGDDDWIFSNSFAEAPEGKNGDPATQTRPWDVDATGDNGIEPSDLQWTLNFQGDTTGRIVGRQYHSTTPAATGVHLNANAGVECVLTLAADVPSPRTVTTLKVGDVVEFVISGQIAGGANSISGQENGIMQFVHDLDMDTGGIFRFIGVEPLGSFSTTRASLQVEQGVSGDRGVHSINGYTTSFTEGVGGSVPLYKVVYKACRLGSADVNLAPATLANFAAGAPHGVKVGHTDNNGDPDVTSYPSALAVTVVTSVKPDMDGDGDVDLDDVDAFNACARGPRILLPLHCSGADMDGDGDGDQEDMGVIQRCFTGPDQCPPQDCDIIVP